MDKNKDIYYRDTVIKKLRNSIKELLEISECEFCTCPKCAEKKNTCKCPYCLAQYVLATTGGWE